MEINKELAKSLGIYFDSLSKVGKIKDSEVYKLILLDFIAEIIEDDHSIVLEEGEYNILIASLYNTMGTSCMFSFSDYREFKNANKYNNAAAIRLTEDLLIRFTTDDKLRIIL